MAWIPLLEKGGRNLARVLSKLNNLRGLDIPSNNIGDEGIRRVMEAISASSTIETIALWGNNLSDRGARYVAKSLPRSVTQLNLSYNRIGDRGARVLARRLPKSVLYLSLSDNHVGDAAVESITRWCVHLTELDLDNTNISWRGACTLASALPNCSLKTLDLSRTNLGDYGAEVLAKGIRRSSLEKVYVSYCNIGAHGVRALATFGPCLADLYIQGNDFGQDAATDLAEAARRNAQLVRIHSDFDKHVWPAIHDGHARRPVLTVVLGALAHATQALVSKFIRDDGDHAVMIRVLRWLV